jgi:hypothetical protein
METVRSLYNLSHENIEACKKLIAYCEHKKSIVYNAYLLAAQMIETKFIRNPFIIIKKFNTSKNELEELIKQNPKEIELRYIRYTIQVNTPAFVGYNKSIKEDRQFLNQFIKTTSDKALRSHILFYLKNTNDLKDDEKIFL